MPKPTIDAILLPKPELRPRIYAYSIEDKAHAGLLKVGQTSREVKKRVAEQLKTARIKNFTIELDESAEREDGTIFTSTFTRRLPLCVPRASMRSSRRCPANEGSLRRSSPAVEIQNPKQSRSQRLRLPLACGLWCLPLATPDDPSVPAQCLGYLIALGCRRHRRTRK